MGTGRAGAFCIDNRLGRSSKQRIVGTARTLKEAMMKRSVSVVIILCSPAGVVSGQLDRIR